MNVDGVDWEELLNHWEQRVLRWLCRELEIVGLAFGLDAVLRKHAAQLGVSLPLELFKPLTPIQLDDINQVARRMIEAQQLVGRAESLLQWDQRPLRGRSGGYAWAILRNGGLRFAPASDTEIGALEQRLKVTLPSSYRQFLRTSNGWLAMWARLLPASEVDLLKVRDPEVISSFAAEDRQVSDEDYNRYGSEQQAYEYRSAYLLHNIEVSESITEWESFQLCPCKVFPNGEWEAWRMSVAVAGAARFQSFSELMLHVLEKDQREIQGLATP